MFIGAIVEWATFNKFGSNWGQLLWEQGGDIVVLVDCEGK